MGAAAEVLEVMPTAITEANLAAIDADAAEGETSLASLQACLDEAHDALNTECADALNGLSFE